MVQFRSSRAARSSTRRAPGRRPLGVEGLESRHMLAGEGVAAGSVVATGSEVGAGSTPIVRVIDATTGDVQHQFLAYGPAFRGGVRVAMGDVDGDNVPDIITAPGAGRLGQIRVFQLDGTEMVSYRTLPFGPAWRGGVEVASGDVDGNGRDDIIASQSRGRGEVRIFVSVDAVDPIVNAAYRRIIPFGPRFNGGATVAVADVGMFAGGALTDGAAADGRVEIVVGNGPGMRSLVRVYDVSAAPRVAATMRPFPAAFRGGVTLSSGRITADTIDDIVVSSGRGGRGAFEVFNGTIGQGTAAGLARLTAASAGFGRPNTPVHAVPVDLNGDGLADRLFATKGDLHTGLGVASYSTAGVFLGQTSPLTGAFRIAASRPVGEFITTASGLQFRDIVVGTGDLPEQGDLITADFTGTLLDGSVFDSSRTRGTPFEFTLGVGQVIAGWDEAFATMRVGGRRILVIPPELAFGDVPRQGIPPGSTVVFDVEFLAIG